MWGCDVAFVSVSGLNKSYIVGSQHIHVLRNLDLEVAKGEMLAIVGASGVGKSTLLLEVAAQTARYRHRTLYVTGEESASQVRLRADRTNAVEPELYLAAETDRIALREGLKMLRALCRQPGLARFSGAELRPGPAAAGDADLDRVVRQTADSIYHPVGTARMGRDALAVVDSATMGVHGISGLSVADASVMPRIVGGNTNAASILIGALGAEKIAAAL